MDAKSKEKWHSILVKTGIYQDGVEPTSLRHLEDLGVRAETLQDAKQQSVYAA